MGSLKTARDPIVRIRERIRIERGGGCWMWQGPTQRAGYGTIRVGSRTDGSRRTVLVHRFLFERVNGPVPDGLELDHTCHSFDLSCPGGATCRHRRCCNPDHLEAVTPKVNVQRGRAPSTNAAIQRAKTHCPHGHPYDEENTILEVVKGRTCRKCRECRLTKDRKRYREVLSKDACAARGVEPAWRTTEAE